MFRAGTPNDRTALIISLTSSGEEQQAGAPDGLILIPTTSFGSMNFASAACADGSPVSSFSPRSNISCTIGCETRFLTIDRLSAISTTRPGNSPGIPRGDFFLHGASCTSIDGACGSTTSSPGAVNPPTSKLALPMHVRFTNVLRSMAIHAPRLVASSNAPPLLAKLQLTLKSSSFREDDKFSRTE